MSDARRREMEHERQAQISAQALTKEVTRALQRHVEECAALERHQLEKQAAREEWRALSPEQRTERRREAAEAERERQAQLEATQEQSRQRWGSSVDSMQVILTVVAFEALLYGAFLFALYSYIDVCKLIYRHAGDFTAVNRWVGPPTCLCLYVSAKIRRRIELIYSDFGQRFDTWKFLAIFLFAMLPVAFSGLLMFGWLVDRL
jgi:hypothetical protein